MPTSVQVPEVTPAVDRRRWAILGALTLAVTGLEYTVLSEAMPTLQPGIGTSIELLLWIVNGYALVFSRLIVVARAWGDKCAGLAGIAAGQVDR